MTEEQKDILIAKMLEAPASLTAEELDAIMCDEELRDIYNVSVAVGNACIRQPEIDTAREWQRFRQRMTPRRHTGRSKLLIAVSVAVAILTLSGLLYTAMRQPSIDSVSPLLARAEQPAPTTEPGTTCDEEHSLIATEYEDTTEAATEEIDIQAIIELTADTDIDEYLRLQQARIDNELALQNAEMYRLEYAELLDAFANNGADITLLQDDLNRLTMQ